MRVLAGLVRSEAHRTAGEAATDDSERLAAGWERRFIAEGERAAEMIRLYEELGFEVETEPVRGQDFSEDCLDCQVVAQGRFTVIYTRVVSSRPGVKS